MLRQIGTIGFSPERGLMCTAALAHAPEFSERARLTAWLLATTDEVPRPGDYVVHPKNGVGIYHGVETMVVGEREFGVAVVEYAGGDRLNVPADRAGLLQRSASQARQELDVLGGGSAARRYQFEVLRGAYAWPRVGIFPRVPTECTTTAVVAWRASCEAYFAALHAESTYRAEAEDFIAAQRATPCRFVDWWVYRAVVVDAADYERANEFEDVQMLVKEWVLRRERRAVKRERHVEVLEQLSSASSNKRKAIPDAVRLFVWERDGGRCVRCGGNRNLEFDHDIPLSKGGSSTARNLRLLCEFCNRSKGAEI